jgi:hypothetical protein
MVRAGFELSVRSIVVYTLDKLSHPGWELRSEHIEHIFWMLDQHVCTGCKMTKEEFEASEIEVEDYEELGDDVNPYTFTEYRSETYDQWSMLDKVMWLLGTACGCEFEFYTTEY